MSPRKTSPDLFVEVDQTRGIMLVRGEEALTGLQAIGAPRKFSRSRRGWVTESSLLPDLESWCQWRRLLCVVSGRPKPKRVAPEPVFVAPEPQPEPEPDPFEQDKLFGG